MTRRFPQRPLRCCHTDLVTPARRPLVLLSAALIAAVAAVLVVVLPLSSASAQVASASGTRVGAHNPGMILTVGSSRPVPAGQGRDRCLPQPQFVSGLCVAAEGNGPVRPYEVGKYSDLVRRSSVGDQLDIHHVPQGNPAGQVIPGYSYGSAPSIALPAGEHGLIPNLRGTYSGARQDLLARDISNLRAYTNAPESAIQQLQDLISQTYPDTFGPPSC